MCRGNTLMAQQPAKNTPQPQKKNTVDTSDQDKLLHTIHADREGGKKLSDTSEIQYFAGNVQLRQNRTLFDCDSAVLNKYTNIMEAFGHVHINDNDSVNIHSDYLRYQSTDKKAFLKNNVKLSNLKSTLTTSQLDYDVNTHIAVYNLNGRLVTDSSVLTSVSGTYYADTHDATFSKDVVLVDPQYTIRTDTLQYNTFSKIATFTVPTVITSSTRSIETTDGWFDQVHRKGYFSKRPIIKDSASTLIADEVAFNDSLGAGEAGGNVVYKDTVQNIMVLCNNLKTNRVNAAFLATVNPVMIVKQNDDSTFIAADTLYSARYDSSEALPDNRSDLQPHPVKPLSKSVHPPAADSTAPFRQAHPADPAAAKINTPYKKVGKTFVWAIDSASNNIVAKPAADSVPHKPEKKGLFGFFKKKEKDTLPSQQKHAVQNNTGKNIPGVIDSLRNAKTRLDSAALKQAGKGVDLSHDNNSFNKKDSMAPEDKRNRYFEAYYHVRIYNDSMQAIGDSLYYDARDSVFQLFKNPVVWTTANNQISQIAGDTIYMYTDNSKPKYLRVWNNAIMLSQADTLHNPKTSGYYNQMSGRTIEGWFTAGQLDSIKARGDARSVFYMLDEHNKYIGVNTQNSRILDFYFLDKELNKIVGRNDVVGKTYPMREVNHEAIRLRGFDWLEDKRPKSKYELLAH